MRTIFERVTIGERKYTIYENETQLPSGRRRTWEVWRDGVRVFGPGSRTKCYAYLDRVLARGE